MPSNASVSKILRELSIVSNFQDSDDIVWWVHYSRLYDAVIKVNFLFKPNYNIVSVILAEFLYCYAGKACVGT